MGTAQAEVLLNGWTKPVVTTEDLDKTMIEIAKWAELTDTKVCIISPPVLMLQCQIIGEIFCLYVCLTVCKNFACIVRAIEDAVFIFRLNISWVRHFQVPSLFMALLARP